MTELDPQWEKRKEQAAAWFKALQQRICVEFEKIEQELSAGPKVNLPVGEFKHTLWSRENSGIPNASGSILHGGGQTALMHGRVFEKIGVNFSNVWGTFSKEFASKIPGADKSKGEFWASGISLVSHPQSPLVPAVHMNTRMIVTSKGWFGGGTDLTPIYEDPENTAAFHQALKTCCERHSPDSYDEYKAWCDRYFYLPHRDEPRGIGGIFYDYLEHDWEDDFSFTRDVGETFLKIYPALVRKSINKEWTGEQREHQLIKRGRYVEFNLLYDRGTQFGLKTGGNTEAILMSLPPEAKWP